MQKLGLDTQQSRRPTALEAEIAREQATALGLTGRRLDVSLARYRRELLGNPGAARRRHLLEAVAADVAALIVQRELAGLVHENLDWVLGSYDIPEAALRQLGLAVPA